MSRSGSGLQPLSKMSRPTAEIIPSGVKHYPVSVSTFSPASNLIKTSDGTTLSYDYLVVAPGLRTDFAKVPGLSEALEDEEVPVSSIYSDKSVEKVWRNVKAFKGGKAVSGGKPC